MSNLDQPSGKLTVIPGNEVKYFIIGGDEMKLKFEQTKKEVINKTVKRIQEENSLHDILNKLKELSPILVTGSSGYLGSALVETLRLHEIPTIGIDLVNATTTDFVGCVSDLEFIRKVTKSGCKSIIHTAALHAPNLDYYSETEYERVNVIGTRNILTTAKEFQIKFVVFSSTTSLMITNEVKQREKEGDHPVVLEELMDYGTPRNIYGLTKKTAETICLDNKDLNIAILRCSRFFAEDVYDTGVKPSERSILTTNGNVKANEILCGTRASLEDTVLAHLVALDRLSDEQKMTIGSNSIIGPLIISSISPLLCNSFDMSVAKDSRLYKECTWTHPNRVCRIYDSTNSWKRLNICPKWNFQRLVREFSQGTNVEIVQEGHY